MTLFQFLYTKGCYCTVLTHPTLPSDLTLNAIERNDQAIKPIWIFLLSIFRENQHTQIWEATLKVARRTLLNKPEGKM